jgi:predicted secreted protein
MSAQDVVLMYAMAEEPEPCTPKAGAARPSPAHRPVTIIATASPVILYFMVVLRPPQPGCAETKRIPAKAEEEEK